MSTEATPARVLRAEMQFSVDHAYVGVVYNHGKGFTLRRIMHERRGAGALPFFEAILEEEGSGTKISLEAHYGYLALFPLLPVLMLLIMLMNGQMPGVVFAGVAELVFRGFVCLNSWSEGVHVEDFLKKITKLGSSAA